MPAKKQVTKQDILDAALRVFRERGMDAINARELGRVLHCSTQPIYFSFTGMDALKADLATHIMSYYESFLTREAQNSPYPSYKAHGMAYIRFAKDEPEMFRFLFMRARTESQQKSERPESYTRPIQAIAAQNGWTFERAERFHMEMWFFVHGIATMFAASYLDLGWDEVSQMVTDIFQGLKKRYADEGGEDT